ncbi:MAG: DUF1730 domain-containing protein [Nitrospiraceae bacterium]|nr:DUF1730 domain-containing protein [Nitrospiraceae bacterium]
MDSLSRAMDLEFPDWGILADPPPVPEWSYFIDWLSRGLHGKLGYLERTAPRRRSLSEGYPGYRSLVMGILPYDPRAFSPSPGPGHAEIARYAVGEDYHTRFEKAFTRVLSRISPHLLPGDEPLIKPDHGALLEKSLAQMAGLGRMGKNTLLIHPEFGSMFTIGSMLLKTPLPERKARPFPRDPCGGCSRCLEACPTGAFESAYILDARRCLSYLTIERPDDDEEGLRKSSGDPWLFGCDRCQEVCPHNAGRTPLVPEAFSPRFVPLDSNAETLVRGLRKVHGALSRASLSRLLSRLEELRGSGSDPKVPGDGEKGGIRL